MKVVSIESLKTFLNTCIRETQVEMADFVKKENYSEVTKDKEQIETYEFIINALDEPDEWNLEVADHAQSV